MASKRKGRPALESGFEPATAENIPEVLFSTMMEYYAENPQLCSAEIRGSKNFRSMRSQYAAEAVGYVQLRRSGVLCHVKARVTPEHRVNSPAYNIQTIVEESAENGNTIKECRCLDCPASRGGCKHALALLAWLMSKTSEPSVTSSECYWKTSSLSTAVKHGQIILAADVGTSKRPPVIPSSEDVRQLYYQEGGSGGTMNLLLDASVTITHLHEASVAFRKNSSYFNKSPDNFILYLASNLTEKQCQEAEKMTRDQSNSSLWFELRYGRISASRVFEVSRCKTVDGSLVETIMGAYSVVETTAIKRGKELEERVIKAISPVHERCGLFMKPDYPIFGASPDAITPSHVIEVKCPEKQSTVRNYLDAEGKPTKKFYSQLQLQMFLSGRRKGLFGVASPNFEEDGLVTKVEVDINEVFCKSLMDEAMRFWERAVFPLIMKASENMV